MLPSCSICIDPFHPVDRPCQRINCGHTLCESCTDGLFDHGMSCPMRCQGNGGLRRRDVRPLDISIVATTEYDDEPAVLRILIGLLEKRKDLSDLASSNTATIANLSKFIANQLESLARFTATYRKLVPQYQEVMRNLQQSQTRLAEAIEENTSLVSELLHAQNELRKATTPSPGSCTVRSMKRKADEKSDLNGRASQRRRRI